MYPETWHFVLGVLCRELAKCLGERAKRIHNAQKCGEEEPTVFLLLLLRLRLSPLSQSRLIKPFSHEVL